jgi:hypothetical protein
MPLRLALRKRKTTKAGLRAIRSCLLAVSSSLFFVQPGKKKGGNPIFFKLLRRVLSYILLIFAHNI